MSVWRVDPPLRVEILQLKSHFHVAQILIFVVCVSNRTEEIHSSAPSAQILGKRTHLRGLRGPASRSQQSTILAEGRCLDGDPGSIHPFFVTCPHPPCQPASPWAGQRVPARQQHQPSGSGHLRQLERNRCLFVGFVGYHLWTFFNLRSGFNLFVEMRTVGLTKVRGVKSRSSRIYQSPIFQTLSAKKNHKSPFFLGPKNASDTSFPKFGGSKMHQKMAPALQGRSLVPPHCRAQARRVPS